MIRRAFRALWAEPRVPEPPGRPWWDWVLIAVLVPVTVIEGLVVRTDVPWPVLSIALPLVCVAMLAWRRSHPLVALVVAFGAQTVAGVAPNLAGIDDQVLDTTAVVLLFPYSLCRWARGRDAIIGLVFLLGAHFAREPILGETAAMIVVGTGFLLFPAALGAAVRFQRTARVREVDQARTREREQLARELHDTVAHHVSAIVIQAQAGRTIATADPDRAAQVFADIEGAAVRSLADMRSVVGILRDGAEAERAPIPGIGDLERLAGSDAGGLRVDLRLTGPLDRLAASVDAAVYRLVQESLTNAQRHARDATAVEVRVAGEPEQVRVEVADDGRHATRANGSGYGLTGMTERVEMLGGTLRCGPRPDGGWTVSATIPIGTGAS